MSKNKIDEEVVEKVQSPTPPGIGRNLTIRTTAIYPKNSKPKVDKEVAPSTTRKPNFKFPLIPDQIPESPIPINEQMKEIEPVFKPQKAKRATVFQPESKVRFRPTQVISPIYGYHRPKPKVEEEPVVVENTSIQLAEPILEETPVLMDHPIMEESFSTDRISVQVAEPLQEEIPEVVDDLGVEVRPLPKKEAIEVGVPFQVEETPVSHVSVWSPPPPIQVQEPEKRGLAQPYHRPYCGLLKSVPLLRQESTEEVLRQQETLAETLRNFHVNAEVIGAVQGPSVTRYEIQPAAGVKVNKITNLADDLKLSLAARDIRIEAPIPGRSAIGIEVPNEKSRPVYLREIIESEDFRRQSSPLTVALGVDIGGKPMVTDLSTMPHGLIAGATGSGKSVCIHSLILSLLFKATPEEVRILLIDPKMVELAPYNRLPHLVTPVVTDPKQATAALKWAVEEMDKRYEQFAEAGVRDLSRYNDLMKRTYPGENRSLPSIVIIIDELADLMMVAPQDVEEAICRIAQKARACGIHLLVATQRPSVDVITGLIKANIPSRIAFSVSSQTDSRTILDMGGAERLLGRGDMLFLGSGSGKPVRLQGPFVSDEEIDRVTTYIKGQREPEYLFEKEALNVNLGGDEADDLFADAVLFCVDNGQASASSLQRNFRIGYNRAARLIEMMEAKGFISGQSGSKPRDVFLSLDEYEEIFMK